MKIIETDRLYLEETTKDDFENLKEVIIDPINMQYYKGPYDDNGVNRWLDWCIDSYKTNGFGLWKVIRKNDNKYLGDAGLSLQNINGVIVPEIGYHIIFSEHHKGYASEASKFIKEYIFNKYTFNELYSYMNKDNIYSRLTAVKNDMSLKLVYDLDGVIHTVYSIKRNTFDLFKKYSSIYIYRNSLPKDLDKLRNLIGQYIYMFPGLEDEEFFNSYIESLKDKILNGETIIVEDNNKIIAYIEISINNNSIDFFLVDKSYRRKGIGKCLMDIAISKLDRNKDIYLGTYTEDDYRKEEAWNFYLKYGFIMGDIGYDGPIPSRNFILKGKKEE